jgi:hypothetical protein
MFQAHEPDDFSTHEQAFGDALREEIMNGEELGRALSKAYKKLSLKNCPFCGGDLNQESKVAKSAFVTNPGASYTNPGNS